MNLHSDAGRAKYCKKGCRYPPLCLKREATSDNNFIKHLQKKKEWPKIQVQILKLHRISGVSWKTHTYRNHAAPRAKLFVPKDDFTIPLNFVDVQRQTKTSLDVLQEATIDDYWNNDCDKSLSEPCIGVTRFALNKNPPQGNMVTTRPGNICPEEWSEMLAHSAKP